MKHQLILRGFRDFIRRQGVVGLAVGCLLGVAVIQIVALLISSMINPIIDILLGAVGNLKGWSGAITTLIDFLIIATIIYCAFRGIRMDALDAEKKEKK